MFNFNRLSLARKRRKLTSKNLAELIDVSPVTITRIEKGKNEPNSDTIEKIAKALNFPKDFFLGSDFDELTKDSASFRSMVAMTAKERDAALAAGALAFIISDWVSERFELPKLELPDIGRESNPSSAAIALRQYWGIGEQPINDMIKLLESKGLRIFSLSESTKNVDAFSCWRNGIPFIFLNTFKSAEHSRFDAAHELGHLVLHKHGGPQQGREAEKEADNFASSFLMPRSDIVAKIRHVSSVDQLILAKKRWRVSVMALAYRLHDIGIISDRIYRMLCIQINRQGYRTNEPNEIAREKSVLWEKVFTTLWSEKITKQHIAKDLIIPVEEIDDLVFGIFGFQETQKQFNEKEHQFPNLKVIGN